MVKLMVGAENLDQFRRMLVYRGPPNPVVIDQILSSS